MKFTKQQARDMQIVRNQLLRSRIETWKTGGYWSARVKGFPGRTIHRDREAAIQRALGTCFMHRRRNMKLIKQVLSPNTLATLVPFEAYYLPGVEEAA